jgi:Domain of unknown function (DUF1840)
VVTFRSKAYADLVMFRGIAVRLIKLMGHSGTVPGAILAEDIDAALARLENAIEAEKAASAANEPRERNEDSSEPRAVSLAVRAWPLIEMLTAAAAAKCNVMWDQ